jgi:hypothetical protein
MMRLFLKVKDICLLLCLFFSLLLPVGTWAQNVLVAGGEVSPGPPALYTATAEVYDPVAATWTPTNVIPNAPPDTVGGLCAPNMVLLGNRRVLLAGGGCTDQGLTTNATSLYDPTTNKWTANGTGIPNFMSFGRDQFGMVALTNGNAFAFAGCAGGCVGPNILNQRVATVGVSSEIFDIQTNQWTTKASLNFIRGNLSSSNLTQSGTLLQDGRVLTCNGTDGVITGRTDCEVYDTVANTWTITAGALGETGGHQLVLLATGKVLTVKKDGISAILFDPSSGTWTSTGSLGSAQIGGQLLSLSDGRILDSGGTDGTNPVNTAQIYDPTSGTWSTTAPMGTSRVGHIAVRLADGRVLAAGGQTTGSTILSSAEIFNPILGTWSPTTPMTQARVFANALLLGSGVPQINQPLLPDAVPAGGSGFTLTVNGAGFVSSSVVNWNGTPLTTTFVSHDQVTATVPTVDIAAAGTALITVSNPSPGGGISNGIPFTIRAPATSVSLSGSSFQSQGFNPFGIVVADFNKDGIPDLALVDNCGNDSTCQSPGTVIVLLGNGDGTFSFKAALTAGNSPTLLVVGDFNNDGNLDLAVVNSTSASVSVFLGNGDGTFTTGTGLAADSVFSNLVAGDFNGDGKLDLALADDSLDTIDIFLGNGDGTFTEVAFPSVASSPNWVVTGDFNGDGILDLAVSSNTPGSNSGSVSILLGNGDGTFTAGASIPFSTVVSLTLGDFNNDGILDLAVVDQGLNLVTVLLGNGDGTFTRTESTLTTDNAPNFIATADMNGDGNLDLIVSNLCGSVANCTTGTPGSISIFLGDGKGGFGSKLSTAVQNQPQALALGDFNGDGRLDVLVTNSSSNSVSVLLQVTPTTCETTHTQTGFTIGATVSCTGNFVQGNQNQFMGFTWGDGTQTGSGSGGGSNCGVTPGFCTFSATHTYSAANTYSVTPTVTDASGNMVIVTGFMVNIPSTLAINPITLPSGTVGVNYTPTTLTATGGSGSLTWSIVSGSLPMGLALNPTTGVISGMPASSGTSNFTVQVEDSAFDVATSALSITVASPLLLKITTTTLPSGTIGTPYSSTMLQATGGAPPYSWSLASGSTPLPPGIVLSALGVISGTPNIAGTFSFTVQVTDTTGAIGTQLFGIAITSPPGAPTCQPPNIQVNSNTSPLSVTATSNCTDATGSIAGTTVDWGDGTALSSGTPASHTYTSAGTFSVTVTATDTNGLSATASGSVTVTVPLATPVPQGQSAQQSVMVTAPLGVQSVQVTYACTSVNGPNGVQSFNSNSYGLTCNISPQTVTLTGTATSVQISVSTSSSSGSGMLLRPGAARGGAGWLYAAFLPLAGIALLGIGTGSTKNRKEKILRYAAFLLLGALMCCWLACGSSITPPPASTSLTPGGRYSVSVTGTSSGSTTSSTVTVGFTVTVGG